ncbi:MAG TPA: ChbG/HpnK family deacetylase [Solirubrobacterales bacterium]|jgi:predicted glycoside hydrolase/deacetylase ChbG (UPF0249 family)
MTESAEPTSRLIVTADDWGYSASYNEGIEEAARARAVDAVSVMVLRPACDPAPLLDCEVELGLHLELPEGGRRAVLEAPGRQAERFGRLFGVAPAYIDGHHHCHARLPLASAVEELAMQLRVPVRSVGEDHRYRLQELGVPCPDRLIGRLHEGEPVLPRLLAEALQGGTLPEGATEWVVHPGHRDPDCGSGYDRGREEDLNLLLRLAEEGSLAAARTTHRSALAARAGVPGGPERGGS